MDQPVQRIPLPKWACHKVVEAAKIVDVAYAQAGFESSAKLTLNLRVGVDIEGDPVHVVIDVDGKYAEKHEPRVGGYYVRYADGYESYSPAEAFESGYARIPKTKDYDL
jgi:hypothetical protein